MFCSIIGSICPQIVLQDNNLIFVMMPFRGFDNIYDQIKISVEGIEGKKFKCLRADEGYTPFSIWCKKICKNIRKAKYVIVDVTGKNPNVFYELGFAHALQNKKAIIITQNLNDLPFDIAVFNTIEYSIKNFRQLREILISALKTLERQDGELKPKSTEEMLQEFSYRFREEEKRAGKYRENMLECEQREEKLKKRIRMLEYIEKEAFRANII